MKILKIKDDIHQKLKEHLKDEKVFMQEYVEHIIEDSIKNNYLYMNLENLITSLEELVTIKKIKGDKYSLHYVDFGVDPSANYQEFSVTSSNIEDIITWYTNIPNAKYFNIIGSNCVTATDIYNEDMYNLPYIEIMHIDPLNIEILKNNIIKSTLKRSITIKLWNYHSIKNEDVVYLLKQKTKNDLEFGDFEDVELMGILSPKVLNKKGVLSDISETFKQDVVKKIIEFCHKNNETNLELILDDKDDINISYRKTISKIIMAGSVIAVGGRIGAGNTVLIGEKIYNIIKNNNAGTEILKIENPDFTYVGKIADLSVIYDKSIDDDNIYVYRKNNIDMPNIAVILDETPTLGNIKGVIVDIGLQPHLQFKAISILDNISIDKDEDVIQKMLDSYVFIQKNPNHSKFNLIDFKISTVLIHNEETPKQLASDVIGHLLKNDDTTGLDKIIIGNINFNKQLVDDKILDMIINNCDKNNISIITNCVVGAYLQDMLNFIFDKSEIKIRLISGIYIIGTIKHNDKIIHVYVNPYMRYNDKRIFIINDFRLSYNKTLLRSINVSKNMTSHDILNFNILYKIDKDILFFEIEDSGNFLM